MTRNQYYYLLGGRAHATMRYSARLLNRVAQTTMIVVDVEIVNHTINVTVNGRIPRATFTSSSGLSTFLNTRIMSSSFRLAEVRNMKYGGSEFSRGWILKTSAMSSDSYWMYEDQRYER